MVCMSIHDDFNVTMEVYHQVIHFDSKFVFGVKPSYVSATDPYSGVFLFTHLFLFTVCYDIWINFGFDMII